MDVQRQDAGRGCELLWQERPLDRQVLLEDITAVQQVLEQMRDDLAAAAEQQPGTMTASVREVDLDANEVTLRLELLTAPEHSAPASMRCPSPHALAAARVLCPMGTDPAGPCQPCIEKCLDGIARGQAAQLHADLARKLS